MMAAGILSQKTKRPIKALHAASKHSGKRPNSGAVRAVPLPAPGAPPKTGPVRPRRRRPGRSPPVVEERRHERQIHLRPAGRSPPEPVPGGVFLGLVLLTSFLTLGAGLGASRAFARASAFAQSCVMPQHVARSAYFGAWGNDPLRYYLVFMFVGTLFGGLVSAIAGRRVHPQLERGPTASRRLRAALALAAACWPGSRAGWPRVARRAGVDRRGDAGDGQPFVPGRDVRERLRDGVVCPEAMAVITTFFGQDGLGSNAALVLSLLLGFGFGVALEQAGFGSSRGWPASSTSAT